MEDGLGAPLRPNIRPKTGIVLILVLVEDGLGAKQAMFLYLITRSLNPCFSGGWSRSRVNNEAIKELCSVLILVLVEDGLGEGPTKPKELLLYWRS